MLDLTRRRFFFLGAAAGLSSALWPGDWVRSSAGIFTQSSLSTPVHYTPIQEWLDALNALWDVHHITPDETIWMSDARAKQLGIELPLVVDA